MKSLAKNSIYNAVYQVLNIVFPLISSIYVSRIIFADGVGRVTYAQNVVSYFTTVAALGIPTVGVRVIAIARDNRQRLDKAFSEMIVLNTLSTSLAVAAYVVVLFVNPELRSDIFLYAATGIVLVFHYISIDWLFQGLEEYSYIVIRNIVVKILSLMALFLFVKNREDYLKYALILSLATCSNYLFNAIHSRKYVSLVFKHLDLKQHIKPILLISGSLFLASIYGKLDITMLGTMIGTESVGYYSYAHRIIQIGISFCTAVTAAFFPRLSYYFQHDSEKFRSLILRGIQITAFLSFPVATGMFILAPEIVELLYGPMFLPAIGVLRIFSVLTVTISFGNLLCYQLMMCSGNEKKHVFVLAIATCLNIVMNYLLIPVLQHEGAAIASVCTEGAINIIELLYIKRKLELSYKWKPIVHALFCSAIMAVVVIVLNNWIDNMMISLVCCVPVGFLVYVIINLLIKNSLTLEVIAVLKKRIRRG